MVPPGPGPPFAYSLVLQQAGPLRGLEGACIYTVELFRGHQAAALFRCPFIVLFWVH